MENKIKMVARIAGEEVYVGECNSARARILVKRSYASWCEGKILLHILNVHDQLLANGTQNFRGPLDDENVSEREMGRRLAWFRAFMVKATEALTPRLQRFPSVEEAEAWYQARHPFSTKSVYEEFPGWESYYEDVPLQEATSLSYPEDFKSWEAYYKNPTYKEGLPPISSEMDEDFVSLWEPTPNVYAIFPTMQGVSYAAPTRAVTTTDIFEQEARVVATLKQVLCYQHGPASSEYDNFNARPENAFGEDEGSLSTAK